LSKLATRLRLDRLLGNLGYGSRKEIQGLARAGGVTLDGLDLTDASAKIEVTVDLSARMKVDGQALDPPPGLVLMLHKPLGVTCSHKEAGALVYDLLPARWRRRDPALSTVGRLDKDTSGLLLLTDDGALLHRIIAPSARIEKRYRATLARPLDGTEADLFASGTLMLDNESTPLLPARLEPISETEAYLAVTEGRYHQVRRMFAAAGNHVEALHRDRVGGLALSEDLAAGRYRVLGDAEIGAIFNV
jgi:16S rRNA pseudouridine516 synthase